MLLMCNVNVTNCSESKTTHEPKTYFDNDNEIQQQTCS